jgi:hypothetical protein
MDGVLQFLFSFIFDNRQTLEKKYFPFKKNSNLLPRSLCRKLLGKKNLPT